MVIDSMFIYHFVDPDLRVEIFFEKDETPENGGVDFELGEIGTSCTELKVEENLFVFVTKKMLLEALLTCTFIPSLSSSESRKKYTLRILLTCLDILEEGFSCFPWRNWEWISRNLFSLVKLYPRILI